MKTVDDFLNLHNWSPQQVQDYIPLPMTMGGAMYYTGLSPDGSTIEVNRGLAERRTQINMLKKKRPGARPREKYGKCGANSASRNDQPNRSNSEKNGKFFAYKKSRPPRKDSPKQ